MEREEFEELVDEAFSEIPKEYLEKIENVAIVVEDYPSYEQRVKLNLRRGITLFGLYEGVSLLNRGTNYTAIMPDKITIFKNPIENASKDYTDMKEKIKQTVRHEIAHHFGMSEKEVRKAEAKHKKS